jgi:hypothetical protein
MSWAVAVVLIVGIVFTYEIVDTAVKGAVKILAHKENIERLRNGYPPIEEKGGKFKRKKDTKKIEKHEDYEEFDEYDEKRN